jgi:hypothetical protein
VSVSGDTLRGYNSPTYQWLLNGAPIPGATTPVYIVHQPGSYSLQISDGNGCLAVSTPVLITGLSHEQLESSISVYPNPTSTGWQLAVSKELMGSVIEVFDATGQLVYHSDIRQQTQDMRLANAAAGVYELRIISQQGSYARKLVKM